jgi:hypothetical protein
MLGVIYSRVVSWICKSKIKWRKDKLSPAMAMKAPRGRLGRAPTHSWLQQ